MLEIDEPEILDGSRAWLKSQELLAGVPDALRQRREVESAWYTTGVDEHEGAFCLIQSGGPLEDLVGDIVQVVYKQKPPIFVYCIGGAELPTPLALSRQAFMRIALLSKDSIRVTVRPLA